MVATVNSTGTSTGVVITPDSSGVLALQTGGTTAVTVDTSQNVGIGTSSPSQKLAVTGGIASTAGISALAASTTFFDFNSGIGRFAAVSGTTGTAAPITLSQYSSNGSVGRDAVLIDSSGNLLVGTTSADGRISAKGADNSSSNWTIYSRDSSGNPIFGARNDRQVYAGGITATTGTALVLDSSGYIKTLSSSLRYKKDVEPIDIGLDFVLQLNPVKYNLKEGNIAQVGFIAEDFPEKRLVSNSMVDDQDESKGLQVEGVNYAQIVAPLVKAIQEQQATITAQAETINALTARVVALESK